MRINKIVMHNFGVYASTNELKLQGKNPVVLIGGLNGRGKTTILEAVLLGLYGSNSFAYIESKYQTYGQYLRSYVNKSDGTLTSYVDLEFSMDEDVYYIHREWNAKGVRLREKIDVKKNGDSSSFLTENWPMFVENILPSALASFFFFDGEKISELAVEDTSEQMKESIKAMLGISVLDVLESDLGKIIRKINRKINENPDLVELEQLQERRDKAAIDLQMADDNINILDKKLDILKLKLEKKSNEYSIKGGDIVDRKQELIRQRAEYMVAFTDSNEKLLEIASGELPLLMVSSLLKEIQKQGEIEQSQKTTEMAFRKAEEMYESFSKQSKTKSNEIEAFLAYINAEIKDIQESPYNLLDSTLYEITMLNKKYLSENKQKIKKIIKTRERVAKKIEEIEGNLSVDIDDVAINKVFKAIKSIEREIMDTEVKLEALQKERTVLHGNSMTANSEFSKKVESALFALEAVDTDERTIKYAHMAMQIVSLYKKRLQERKTDILAQTMTMCYKKLANKKNLVSKIEMDSETLDLRYINNHGEEIAKKRLSAGEKQLMVISLLWALAICSKKKLPVIIDTPLSRLDSSHRVALIKTYFPNASDQTIILSTDSEIDGKYYNLMKPSIGDEFTLQYDDSEKKTTIKQGYFDWGGDC